MRSSFFRLASFVVVIGFIGYWIWLPLLSLPHIPKKASMVAAFPKPTKWLVYNWRFFARPGTFNQRVYLIASTTTRQITDTMELVKPIVDRKQQEAPFNQQANIFDHFIHYTNAIIHRNVIQQRSKLEMDHPGLPDSFYLNKLPPILSNTKESIPALLAMDRYCKRILTAQKPWNHYTVFKYLITASIIPPPGDSSTSAANEIIIYDSGNHPI